jgi:glyoxylase-like metal-dependent hydrolase (beta-lactamase superfamily II)
MGVGNTMMITTDEGNVIFDTGLVLQVEPQLRLLKEESDAPVKYIVLSHSYADHIGGARFWQEEDTEIVTHGDFLEEQRYLSQLEPYQYGRNRTLFPWMPAWEDKSDIEMMRYGGIEPTITVADWETHSFTLGGVEFQVIGTPGAEGADNAVLWLPAQKILFAGDFSARSFHNSLLYLPCAAKKFASQWST